MQRVFCVYFFSPPRHPSSRRGCLTLSLPPSLHRGIDLKHGGRQIGKSHRKEAKSENVYLRLLTKVRSVPPISPFPLPAHHPGPPPTALLLPRAPHGLGL